MARVNVPVVSVTKAGVAAGTEVNGDATNFHEVSNNGSTWIEVRNADGAATHILTIKVSRTVDGQGVTSRSYTIPISATTRKIRLGDPAIYGNPTQVDVDSTQLKLTAYTLE